MEELDKVLFKHKDLFREYFTTKLSEKLQPIGVPDSESWAYKRAYKDGQAASYKALIILIDNIEKRKTQNNEFDRHSK